MQNVRLSSTLRSLLSNNTEEALRVFIVIANFAARRLVREIDSTGESSAEVPTDEIFDLFHFGSGKWFVSVQVVGHTVKFVDDTGAD